MSKERLEEIEKRVFSRTFHTELEVDMITIPERDYIYLKEQTKRVQELETKHYRQELIDEHIERLEQQNKRYRELLEDTQTVQTWGQWNKLTLTERINETLEDE